MIRSLSTLGAETLPLYDVLIVGGGPAGLTLARELGGRGLRVAIAESGLRHTTPYGDALRDVESRGIQVRVSSRERVLGGASSTWAGLSAPLDPIDLTTRHWVPGSGWPIEHHELQTWYRAAADRYRFPGWELFSRASPDRWTQLRAMGDLQPEWEWLSEKIFLASDPPQRFGDDWPETWEQPDSDVWLDATVTALIAGRDRRVASAALVRSSNGAEHRLDARVFVLAAGGIENARLMLASTHAWPEGLGNDFDQVGRCLMNHPKGNQGFVHFARPVSRLPLYFGFLQDGISGYAGLRLKEEEQERQQVLNSYVRLEPVFEWTDSSGVESLVAIVKRTRGLLQSWKRRQGHSVVELRSWAETGDDGGVRAASERRSSLARQLLNVGADLSSVTRYAFARLTRARPLVRVARIRNFMEMEPHPDNRVRLSSLRDRHGVPVPVVEHSPTALDRRSMVALHETLSRELARRGTARVVDALVQRDPWPIDADASHHMGTTRMGLDPSNSVVDPMGRVHSMDNVYCAGASVFPTSGCANPTFTIVALSIRLAHHVATLFRGPEHDARTARATESSSTILPDDISGD